MKFVETIKEEFTLMALLLIPVGVAINIVGGQLIGLLKIPIYLDAIGTILLAMLAGPWVGALTGFLSNAVNAIIAPSFFPFAVVSIVIGLVTGFLSRKKMFLSYRKIVISGIIVAIFAASFAAPIAAYVFGGVTGSGSTLITAVLMAGGRSLLESVFTASIIADLLDKLISVFVAYFIIKNMSLRYLSKFRLGDNYIKKETI